MGASADVQASAEGSSGACEIRNVVQVDLHVRVRSVRRVEVVSHADAPACARVEVIARDGEVVDAPKDADGGAAGEGGIGDAVVVNGRLVGVEQVDPPPV